MDRICNFYSFGFVCNYELCMHFCGWNSISQSRSVIGSSNTIDYTVPMVPWIPECDTFRQSLKWFMLSNALLKSSKMESICFLSLRILAKSLKAGKSWLTQECFSLKPCSSHSRCFCYSGVSSHYNKRYFLGKKTMLLKLIDNFQPCSYLCYLLCTQAQWMNATSLWGRVPDLRNSLNVRVNLRGEEISSENSKWYAPLEILMICYSVLLG